MVPLGTGPAGQVSHGNQPASKKPPYDFDRFSRRPTSRSLEPLDQYGKCPGQPFRFWHTFSLALRTRRTFATWLRRQPLGFLVQQHEPPADGLGAPPAALWSWCSWFLTTVCSGPMRPLRSLFSGFTRWCFGSCFHTWIWACFATCQGLPRRQQSWLLAVTLPRFKILSLGSSGEGSLSPSFGSPPPSCNPPSYLSKAPPILTQFAWSSFRKWANPDSQPCSA